MDHNHLIDNSLHPRNKHAYERSNDSILLCYHYEGIRTSSQSILFNVGNYVQCIRSEQKLCVTCTFAHATRTSDIFRRWNTVLLLIFLRLHSLLYMYDCHMLQRLLHIGFQYSERNERSHTQIVDNSVYTRYSFLTVCEKQKHWNN